MISSSLPRSESFGPLKARRRVTAITYVEKWPQQRIEGHAAMTQRIQAKHGETATKTKPSKWNTAWKIMKSMKNRIRKNKDHVDEMGIV